MPHPVAEKCRDCTFYVSIHPHGNMKLDGECHRFPQQPVWTSDGPGPHVKFHLPHVNGGQITCGEFKTKLHDPPV